MGLRRAEVDMMNLGSTAVESGPKDISVEKSAHREILGENCLMSLTRNLTH